MSRLRHYDLCRRQIRRRLVIDDFDCKVHQLAEEGKLEELLKMIRDDLTKLKACEEAFTLIDCCQKIAGHIPEFTDWCANVAIWSHQIIKRTNNG